MRRRRRRRSVTVPWWRVPPLRPDAVAPGIVASLMMYSPLSPLRPLFGGLPRLMTTIAAGDVGLTDATCSSLVRGVASSAAEVAHRLCGNSDRAGRAWPGDATDDGDCSS